MRAKHRLLLVQFVHISGTHGMHSLSWRTSPVVKFSLSWKITLLLGRRWSEGERQTEHEQETKKARRRDRNKGKNIMKREKRHMKHETALPQSIRCATSISFPYYTTNFTHDPSFNLTDSHFNSHSVHVFMRPRVLTTIWLSAKNTALHLDLKVIVSVGTESSVVADPKPPIVRCT